MKRVVITAAVAALLFLSAAAPAGASPLQLDTLDIFDSSGRRLASFSFTPEQYSYQLELDEPQTLRISAAAAGLIISANQQRGDGQLQLEHFAAEGQSQLSIKVSDDSGGSIYRLRFIVNSYQEPSLPPLGLPDAADAPALPPPQPPQPPPPLPQTPDITPPPQQQQPPPQPGQDEILARLDELDELSEEDEGQPLLMEDEGAPLHVEAGWRTVRIELQIGNPVALVDGVATPLSAAPYIYSVERLGYTMVPLRFIGEAFGAELSWEPHSKSVGLSLDGRQFSLIIGQPVPGSPVAAAIVSGRTFVPLRYVAESLGAEVGWEPTEKRINITYQRREQ